MKLKIILCKPNYLHKDGSIKPAHIGVYPNGNTYYYCYKSEMYSNPV